MISADGGLPAHRYTPQVTQRWPQGSEPASPGRRFPSFLCGVCRRGWRQVPHHSWLRVVGFFGGGCGGFLCCVCLWCGRCSRFRVFCVFVALVLVADVVLVVVVCVVCAGVRVWCVGGVFGCLPSPLRAWVGGSVWVWELCVVVPRQSWLRGLGVVPCHSWLGFGGGGAFFSPLACSVPSSPWLRCLACCSPGVCPRTTRAVVDVRWGWVGGGGFDAGSGLIPWCFPLGGPMLAPPVRV